MRLVLTVAVFGTALTLIGVGSEGADQAERGLYWSVALAFLASAIFGLVSRLPRFRRVVLWYLIPLDVAIVTSVVHFSGGPESIFSFLYALVPLQAASVLGASGAFTAAFCTAAAYGGILIGYHYALIGYYGLSPLGDTDALQYLWSVHCAFQLFVAILASGLSREARSIEAVLDQRTEDLDQLRGLHERTVASLMSGLLTTDLSYRITSFNAEAEKITQFQRSEVLSLTIDEVIPEAAVHVLGRAAETKRGRVRIPFQRRAGEWIHLGLAGSVLRDRNQEPTGYVVIFQDITDVVAMEEELRRSERLAVLGQFAAGLAHEIRNPLAAISGSVQMIGEAGWARGPEAGEAQQLMKIVVREADRLSALIESFMSYARPAPAKLIEVSLSTIVSEIVSLSEVSRSRDIRCVVEIPSTLKILADANQIRQVCWNLILNACQAMPHGGELMIVATRSQGVFSNNRSQVDAADYVDLCFKDTGKGIDPELLDRVFDPFVTTKPRGTGLGLAVVHRIVDSLGGTIKMKSSRGVGTEVHLILPMAEVIA